MSQRQIQQGQWHKRNQRNTRLAGHRQAGGHHRCYHPGSAQGTSKAFDSDIHALWRHPGQIEMARRFHTLLDSDHHPSEIEESHRFWSPGCLHYTPQVHDIVNNTIDFAQKIINRDQQCLCQPCALRFLAMELLASCQGIEFFHPLLTTTPLEKVYDLVRSVTKALD
ncbi:histidine ammonia-lyase-like isoform X2 [Oncorhynchus clarkii lewisi]|uniref:histidine ammonia-lyase-like isoform X2 n=1 Tax=Oncorhynchus clarkii lewisi TaxID=490388 RepID=UPI0039B94626